MTTEREYRRLPGRSGLFVRNSLWMGSDHVLRVRAHPFTEEYRRYYFRDIQALVATELPNAAAWYGYTIAAIFAVGGGALLYLRHPVWAGLAGLVTLAVFLWSWRRPNCACYIRTQVSTEMLPALRRRGSAQRTIAALKAEIENVQGAVSQEAIDGYDAGLSVPIAAPPRPALKHCSGQLHWALFALMLMRGALDAVIVLMGKYSVTLNALTGTIGAAVLLTGIVALFQQHRSDLARAVRIAVWVSVAWYAASGVAGIVAGIYLGVQLGAKATNPQAIVSDPVMRMYQYASLFGFFAIGGIGLVLLWLHQASSRTPPPLAAGTPGLDGG